MRAPIICGIQQIGIGVPNVHEAWKWYRTHFGMDIPVFEEAAVAGLMLPYTGGQPQARHAVLAINSQGGGGFEIWQYTGRTPQPPTFQPQLGDLGIYIAKIKSRDVAGAYAFLKARGVTLLGSLLKAPDGRDHFYLNDPYGNIFEVTSSDDWFHKNDLHTGGAYGAVIGVTDIDKARMLYSNILGYDEVVYDKEGVFEDFATLPSGDGKFRRVLLRHSKPRRGAFSRMLGATEIELVATLDRTPRNIYEGRFWGDLGFIHLCFDINGMEAMRLATTSNGFPFTVDSSNSFDMGEAAGHFSYIEDPDGALIEFVETHKIPILKKIGWYLNLRKRDPEKSLPRWMLRSLALNRVK